MDDVILKEITVPYDLSLKLKNLGFNDKCIGYFGHNNVPLLTRTGVLTNNDFDSIVTIITWQQAFDWIIKKINDNKMSIITYVNKIYISYYDYGVENYNYEFENKGDCLIKLIEIYNEQHTTPLL